MSSWLNPNDSSSSEDDYVYDDIPPPPAPHVAGDFRGWYDSYHSALWDLYEGHVCIGRQMFGPAFNQVGSFHEFVQYVYASMVPGVRG
jgi:hypothetical protein